MTTLREAAQMALDDICGAKLCEVNSMSSRQEMLRLMDKAIEALRAALAQPEQEPVAYWRHTSSINQGWDEFSATKAFDDDIPLYTAPPQQPEQEPVATLFGSLPVYDVPTKQEPVAWMHNFIDEVVIAHRPVDLDRHPDRWTALYKDPTPCQTCEALARTVMMDQTSHDTPPQREWQGLTSDELDMIGDRMRTWNSHSLTDIYVAIEARLKEKNYE